MSQPDYTPHTGLPRGCVRFKLVSPILYSILYSIVAGSPTLKSLQYSRPTVASTTVYSSTVVTYTLTLHYCTLYTTVYTTLFTHYTHYSLFTSTIHSVIHLYSGRYIDRPTERTNTSVRTMVQIRFIMGELVIILGGEATRLN